MKSLTGKKNICQNCLALKRRLLTLIAALCVTSIANALVYIEPVLTAEVTAAKSNLEDTHEQANKELNKLQASMVVVDAGLAKIYQVENTWLDYLKTCYNTIENAHQIVRISKMLYQIPQDIKKFGEAIKNTPVGTLKYGAVVAWAALHKSESNFLKDIEQSYVNSIKIINQLVLNGKSSINKDSLDAQFNIPNDSNMSYHKASLLNSRERIELLDNLNGQLSALRYNVRSATYMIQSITWWGVWRAISPATYYAFIDGERLAKEVIDTF